MRVEPRATYRLQLRGGMDFRRAAALVPYLARLGVSHLYLAPIFQARPGSTHGYDVTDPTRLDGSLGGAEGFAALDAACRAHGLGILLDIVPNHLGAHADNPWWWSLLAWGRASPHAGWFDVDWQARAGGTPGRVLLPVLGAPLREILTSGELRLLWEPARGGFVLGYHDQRFPLTPPSWSILLEHVAPELAARCAASGPADQDALVTAVAPLTGSLLAVMPPPLAELLARQPYRLAWWRLGNDALNWRRFFDITELVGLCIERREVFEASHRLIAELWAAGGLDGLRVDHVDGLADPAGYLRRLAGSCRGWRKGESRPWLLVEKILGPGERLPGGWPVDGTTGYELLNALTGLFVDPAGESVLNTVWQDFGGDPAGFPALVAVAKRLILERSLGAELDRLVARLLELAPADADLSRRAVREGLTALVAALEVYRSYGGGGQLDAADRDRLEAALQRAAAASGLEDPAVLGFLRDVLVERGPGDPKTRPLLRAFEQLTGPVMAKALEDTAFYRWHRLSALNEVGGEPDHFGVAPDGFHALFAERAQAGRRALIATATHDTKRGEDTRLRIAVLSEIGQDWGTAVARWRELAAPLVMPTTAGPAPDPATEYLIYQTVLGIWPPGLRADDADGLAALADRLVDYLRKAGREAKLKTSWTAPDETYERGVEAFARSVLDPGRSGELLAAIAALAQRIARPAAVHGLAQTLLKLTLPGVPDIYQGTEGWDLSLVDPDNRRPPDFERLAAGLDPAAAPAALLAAWPDGRIKQWLIARVLALRAGLPGPFARGSYEPLAVRGREAGRLLAFARSAGRERLLVIVPRLVTPLLEPTGGALAIAPRAWGETAVEVGRGRAQDLLTGRELRSEGLLAAAGLLAPLPVALLRWRVSRR
jgi:(1->4)-alpha-D-glucan 1-alpha-D-glucosylmutase